MAALFLDTSALVRRYDRREPGSARVRSLCRRATGNVLVIARVAAVELASAFSRKQREGNLNAADWRRHWRLFRSHEREQYAIIDMDTLMIRTAVRLLGRHPLRAYDAIQLATGLRAAQAIGSRGELRFCTADTALARAAGLERLTVELIS